MKYRIQVIVSLTVAVWCIICSSSQAEGNDPLSPITFIHIKAGGFWKQQAKLLTEKWLPHCIQEMEAGGKGEELLNLIETGKLLHGETVGKFRGAPWADAYVYNTIESICLALAIDPEGDETLAGAQDFLREKMEAWIGIILAAQMEDGYIHSFHCLNNKPRFTQIDDHEFYVMGYFLEMGVTHYGMTEGKDRRLYDAALKCADLLCDNFGPEPKRTWKNGHPGLEYALFRLARLVNAVEGNDAGRKYADLAKHFLDYQHKILPNEYNQSHIPALQMETAAGHAVRATYFYTAMADVALTGDQDYADAVDKIWANAIHCKYYITGGVGASEQGEAFAGDFELPNHGYCESCAGCGMTFWAERMHRLHGDAHYCDVQERVLYNNILGAIERTGENFFYQNPLESDKARYPWHGCPCCVGNIPRALLAIKDLMYSTNSAKDVLYINHFADSEATIPNLAGAFLLIRQETEYPWKGDVKVTVHPDAPAEFTLKVRIPNRTESNLYKAVPDLSGRFTISVNGTEEALAQEKGYVSIRRTWKEGDVISLSLPMDVQRVYCDERVEANRGRVALQRGPLVYNLEEVDLTGWFRKPALKRNIPLKEEWRSDLLGGVMVISGKNCMAVPNFVRLNRGGASRVWVKEN